MTQPGEHTEATSATQHERSPAASEARSNAPPGAAASTTRRASVEPATQPADRERDQKRRISATPNVEQMMRAAAPKSILAKCLFESFVNMDDFTSYCAEHFEEFYKDLRATSTFSSSTQALIHHCYARGRVEYLWETIRQERPTNYDQYHPEWEIASGAGGTASRWSSEFGGSEYGQQQSVAQDKPDASTAHRHPLAQQDETAIANWFYDELTVDEQALVLSTALFEGLDRKHLLSISRELARTILEQTRPNGGV